MHAGLRSESASSIRLQPEPESQKRLYLKKSRSNIQNAQEHRCRSIGKRACAHRLGTAEAWRHILCQDRSRDGMID
jgi:hypothetical protein